MTDVYAIFAVLALPSLIGYLAGRYCVWRYLGLFAAVLWLPSLLLFCSPAARGTVLGASLLALAPTIIGFYCGAWRRPPAKLDRNA